MTEPSLIFETVHGSRAYGLDRPGSDIDLKGVVIGPLAWYFGWRGAPEQIEHSPDCVHYELRKFVRLCAGANPTLLELRWPRPTSPPTSWPCCTANAATRPPDSTGASTSRG